MTASRKILVYKLISRNVKALNIESNQYLFKKWSPGILRVLPPNTTTRYIYFWFIHHLKIFKSKNYCAYVLYKDKRIISSLVCIPAMYKWSFMKTNDIQIKNIYTHESYRGNGYAYALLNMAMLKLKDDNRTYWYMTNEDNLPSQKFCQKAGFEFVGYYSRKRNKYFIYEGHVI